MAFHPFGFFRKRQKSLLAALTILSMFIFILTGFSGSIVDRAGQMFGNKGKDSTEVTKLNGKTVTVSDVDQALQSRRMANAFMMQAIAAAQPTLPDAERNEVMARIQEAIQASFRNMMAGPDAMRVQLLAYKQELLKANKNEAARYVQHWLHTIDLAGWERSHPNQFYFGGGAGPDNLLDFLLWQKQADELGINLTDADLRKAVNAEADSDVLTGDPTKDADKVSLYLRGQFRSVDPKTVYNALRDEFRVRLAKEILLGSAGSARAAAGGGLVGEEVPGEGTPAEFWDYYKDNRTTLKVDFLKIPVKQFIEQVKAEPSQQELEDLYRRYKNDEPNPEKPTPGFKLPRKVKVEWVEANPESAHYREAAEKALPVLRASGPLSLLSFPAVSYASSAGPGGAAAQLAVGSLWNVPQQFEYLAYLKGVKSWWDASNVIPEGTNPYATGLRRTDTVAAVTGQLLGSGLTAGSPWTAAGALGGSVEVRLAEQKARQASMVLAGAGPFPLSVAAQEAALSEVPMPRESAVMADLTASLRDRLAPQMAEAALAEFVKGLEAKRFDPQAAADYVKQQATPDHGITAHGAMTTAEDENRIADAGDLAPLRRAEEKGIPFTPSARRNFARQFFTATGMDGRETQTQPYQPKEIPDIRTRATYNWWLTESEKPRVRTLAEAKADVVEAWKAGQARKDARQLADKLVEDLKKRGEGISADRFLKDEAERLKSASPGAGFETFDLINIARLVRSDMPFLTTTRYEPYRFPETSIAYPRADTVDDLLSKLQQPGDAAVFTDRPERNVYVAVLEERKVPTEREFYDVYQHAPRGIISDSLWSRFQAEREQKYRSEVVRHLREEAKAPLDDQGNYKLDPEVRKRLRGGPGGEE